MKKKTAIQVLKNSLIEVSKHMKSVSIEGLMMSIDDLERIEKECIAEAYSDGCHDGYYDGYDDGCIDSVEHERENINTAYKDGFSDGAGMSNEFNINYCNERFGI